MITKATNKDVRLVVGGESRVDLLPPEVLARAKVRSTRRALAGLVVAAALVTAGGYGAASLAASTNASQLASEQSRTSELLAAQAEFSEVSQVESQLATAVAAAQVGGSTEIDWKAYFDGVRAVLPAGTAITGFTADSADPMELYPQAESPLQGARTGTIVFTARSADLPQIERWLTALAELPGFVDAVPGSITAEDGAGYATTITMHIDAGAYSGRLAPEEQGGEEG